MKKGFILILPLILLFGCAENEIEPVIYDYNGDWEFVSNGFVASFTIENRNHIVSANISVNGYGEGSLENPISVSTGAYGEITNNTERLLLELFDSESNSEFNILFKNLTLSQDSETMTNETVLIVVEDNRSRIIYERTYDDILVTRKE